MKVNIKTNLGTNQFPDMPYRAGDVKDVADDVGKLLIRRGWATEVVQLKAVPPIDLVTSPPASAVALETSTPEVPAVKHKPKGGK